MAKLIIDSRYWIVPNHVLNSPLLSFKAKGLYGYIQSKPEDWDFSAKRIANESSDWVESILSGLKELENAWFLERRTTKKENGQFEHEYFLYQFPLKIEEEPETGNAAPENAACNKELYIVKNIVDKKQKKEGFDHYIKIEEIPWVSDFNLSLYDCLVLLYKFWWTLPKSKSIDDMRDAIHEWMRLHSILEKNGQGSEVLNLSKFKIWKSKYEAHCEAKRPKNAWAKMLTFLTPFEDRKKNKN